ncbi:carbohydrate ABC transporter permease [Eubacteriales bacterium mix99]|jgi:multiple sugar transport system permease protein/putative aldouronate transport system permease protein
MNAVKGSSGFRLSKGDRTYYTIVNVIMLLLLVIVAYPLVYIISASFSSPSAVASGRVVLWPVDFSLEGYQAVFRNKDIVGGYLNTFFYTFAGTALNVIMTMIGAYPLSRKDLKGRDFFMLLFTFTMIFSGGMIPGYILMQQLHLINTPWVMIVPGAISVYNLIITRTFIQSTIPSDLLDASQIDGCSDTRYFFSIVLPLSKSILATITLFYAVGHWNAYFNAFLYLNDRKLFPLQIILREILIANTIDASQVVDPELEQAKQGMADLLKYSLIVVSSLPVMIMYPFVQKYFVKGVMIGAIKG